MQTDLISLLLAAVVVACIHTVMGPDHYLPFIALSKSRRWKFGKTMFWVIACGCGHV